MRRSREPPPFARQPECSGPGPPRTVRVLPHPGGSTFRVPCALCPVSPRPSPLAWDGIGLLADTTALRGRSGFATMALAVTALAVVHARHVNLRSGIPRT